MDTTIVYGGYIGIMEKNKVTTIVSIFRCIGLVEKKMDTTICRGYVQIHWIMLTKGWVNSHQPAARHDGSFTKYTRPTM